MHGVINWFARNSVAANLLMVFIIVYGLASLFRIPLEVFPGFELDGVVINTTLRGASPAEVEENLTIPTEEAIQDIQGIRNLTSTSDEGRSRIVVEIDKAHDVEKVLDDIKQRVDAISTYPDEVDRPQIYVPSRNREVISVVIAGDLPEVEIHRLAARVRDDIEALPRVSSVGISGLRDFEISIEVSEERLRQYGLTLAKLAQAINSNSLDLAAGAIDTTSGEILLRTKGQAYTVDDFGQIAILSRDDGSRVTLADIATIRDGFDEEPLIQHFNDQRSVEIDVFRTGNQSAIAVADDVKAYLENARETMPDGVFLGYWRDNSAIVKARLGTLLKSAWQGGLLIILLLTLFLRFWVAIWVFIGVPISVLGGIATMHYTGVTFNLVSLFAFILVLGIVVDDAIVTGESIYTRMRKNPNRLEAAIQGTHDVAVPVTFGVLTTVAAFMPLLMVEGIRGKIFAQIPMIVIPVLLFSLVESKLILPAHMSHLNFFDKRKPNPLVRLQRAIANGLETAIIRLYRPGLTFALRNRYPTIALFAGAAIIVISIVIGGHVRFVFFPRIPSEVATVNLIMPLGTSFEVTGKHIESITRSAESMRESYINPDTGESVIRDIMSLTGSAGWRDRGSHVGRVMFEITPPEKRSLEVSTQDLIREWRERIGVIPGAEELNFRAELGRGGAPIDIQIAGDDFDELRTVADILKNRLAEFPGVTDITDSFEGGKQEIQLDIKPEAQQLGITLADLANQVRQAFLGYEVQRLQRNRDDVSVIVRYPRDERRSLAHLEQFTVQAPSGARLPFSAVAEASYGRAYSTIKRVQRHRTINVTADIDKGGAEIEGIKRNLQEYVDELSRQYPAIGFSLEGESREQRESFGSLRTGLLFVLLVVYTLLAIPFRSYLQPLMVMTVIPFGVVGSVLGHMIMGMDLSIMSYMGMLALVGVVINDSLVLVDYVNRRRREGTPLFEAVQSAGVARFRAVLLTSLTTFFGLTPLILEKSTQAQFLIPMGVSLGFGILFATVVTLVMIPVNYLILEDLRSLARWLAGRRTPPAVSDQTPLT